MGLSMLFELHASQAGRPLETLGFKLFGNILPAECTVATVFTSSLVRPRFRMH